MAVSPDVSSAFNKATMSQLLDSFLKRTNTGQMAKLDKLTQKVTSLNNARTETFVIEGDMGGFQRWEDGTPRQYTSFETFDYTMSMVKFQNGIRWDRDDQEDIQRGAERIKNTFMNITRKYDLLSVDIFYQILNNSADSRLLKTIPLCPDGLPLFSSNRALFGAGGNIVAGSGVSTVAKLQGDLETAIQRLQALTDTHGDFYHGDSLRQSGLMFIIPTGLYRQFSEAFRLNNIEGVNGGNTDNYVMSQYGNIDILETPRLSGNDWYVFATGEEVHKPIIHMARKDTGGLETRYYDESNSVEMAREDKREMLARVRFAKGCSYNFAGVKISNS